MDWFKRHLNWIMFIVWIGVPFLLLLIGEAIGNSPKASIQERVARKMIKASVNRIADNVAKRWL